jgi:hypothetical protein
MLPPDYTKAVLADYHKKKAANELPFDMKQLSPARFRAACLEVCRERYNRKDERLLKAFFGEAADQKACLLAIDGSKIDKLKPLINFLKQKTNKRIDDKNIELLAWLINFKDRPCEAGKKYSTDGIGPEIPQVPPIEMRIEVGPQETSEKEEKSGPATSEPKEISGKSKKVILTVTILVVLGMVVHWVYPSNSTLPTGRQACMFWANDHYQPVSCNQKMENVQVIALDSEKMVHFIKITRPDTITLNAVGHVWYAKYKGNIEFYTSDGFQPFDPNLRLKHITSYIIRKYIHGEDIADDPGQ